MKLKTQLSHSYAASLFCVKMKEISHSQDETMGFIGLGFNVISFQARSTTKTLRILIFRELITFSHNFLVDKNALSHYRVEIRVKFFTINLFVCNK